MTDTNFRKTLIDLQEKVQKLSRGIQNGSGITEPKSAFTLRIPKINSPLVYYGFIPFGVLAGLVFLRPKFIMVDEVDNTGMSYKKLSYKKLLGWTLVFTAVIAVAIFIYYYKKKKE